MNDQSVAAKVKDKGAEVERLDVEAVNVGAKQKAQPLYAAREAIFPIRHHSTSRSGRISVSGSP